MGLVMVESVLLSFKRFRKKRFIEFLELNVAL